MFTKSIARCSLVACMVLAGAFTPAPTTDPDRTAELVADQTEVSAQKGGWVHFHLQAGSDMAGQWYLILGSISGTAPGVRVRDLTIPLNYDIYTEFTLTRPNAGFIANQLGRLDASGNAEADFYLPPGLAKGFAGMEINHAFVVIHDDGRLTKVSNPAPLLLVD
jgi:hypothetical protein